MKKIWRNKIVNGKQLHNHPEEIHTFGLAGEDLQICKGRKYHVWRKLDYRFTPDYCGDIVCIDCGMYAWIVS